MKSTLLNLLSFTSFLMLIIAFISIILVMFGFRPFILESGSMEPLYTEGSFVWINTRVDIDDVKMGDVLVYRSESGSLVMHRLVDKDTFQGDANKTTEHVPLSRTNLVGRLSFSIPGIGHIVEFTISHLWISRCIAVVLIIISCIPFSFNSSLQ